MRLWVESIYHGYPTIVQKIIQNGEVTCPRGQRTLEVLDAVIEVERPELSLPVGCGRNLKRAIGAVEAAQLVSGVSDPDLTCRVAPNMKQFLDDGVFHGAYGPRVQWQMWTALARLRADRDTRQAVVTIWSPHTDLVSRRDLPCTVMLQFMIRREKLDLHVTMRSNDVWWGLAYDGFQFSQLLCTAARVIGVEVGRYFHHAVSLHIYERDWEKAKFLTEPNGDEPEPLTGFGHDNDSWATCMERAYYILQGHELADLTPTEQWFTDVLSPYHKEEVRG